MIEVAPTSTYTDHARDLSPDEYANLKASIEAVGILKPVLITEDGELLDGKHRRRIADELGLDCPARIVDPTDESEALRMAIDANTTGRLMTREERRELVAKMRANGMSQREVADTLGVSKGTVHNDERSTAQEWAPEQSPSERAAEALAEQPDASMREIAEASGASVGTVANVRRRAEESGTDPVSAVIEGGQRARDRKYAGKWFAAAGRLLDLAKFEDVDRIAQHLDQREWETVEQALESATKHIDKVRRARSGLRVVKGGAS